MVDLEHSFNMAGQIADERGSRLEFLADHVFDFTTYDSAMSELFAAKALDVCVAISNGTTLDYIKAEDNYRWFLLMVNMPFFAGRLEWGTSIRGAWWDYGPQKLESCGLWRGEEQTLTVEFTRDEWLAFIAAVVAFAATDGVNSPDGGQRSGGAG